MLNFAYFIELLSWEKPIMILKNPRVVSHKTNPCEKALHPLNTCHFANNWTIGSFFMTFFGGRKIDLFLQPRIGTVVDTCLTKFSTNHNIFGNPSMHRHHHTIIFD